MGHLGLDQFDLLSELGKVFISGPRRQLVLGKVGTELLKFVEERSPISRLHCHKLINASLRFGNQTIRFSLGGLSRFNRSLHLLIYGWSRRSRLFSGNRRLLGGSRNCGGYFLIGTRSRIVKQALLRTSVSDRLKRSRIVGAVFFSGLLSGSSSLIELLAQFRQALDRHNRVKRTAATFKSQLRFRRRQLGQDDFGITLRQLDGVLASSHLGAVAASLRLGLLVANSAIFLSPLVDDVLESRILIGINGSLGAELIDKLVGRSNTAKI